jgi:hypothetical protein
LQIPHDDELKRRESISIKGYCSAEVILASDIEMVCITRNVTKPQRGVIARSVCLRSFAPACHVGNAVEIPQPNDPTKKFQCTHDAWNRLAEVRETGLPASKQIVADCVNFVFGVAHRRFAPDYCADLL